MPRDLADLVQEGRVGGVVLFARNLRDPVQVRELTASLHALAPREAPLVIAMDQEGGRVQRLREPWTAWPSMRRLALAADLASTRAVARAIAVELRDVGVGLNFAPCVDVDASPDHAIIGDRSFSMDAAAVSAQASAYIDAMQHEQVACCAKHFPGHGGTTIDSHSELPRLRQSLEALRRTALPPFRAAAKSGVAAMMTAHIVFERVDARRPATLSRAVLELLRHEVGFEGVVFTDDLEMRAVVDHDTPAGLTLGSLKAGADAVLVCRHADFREEALAVLERAPDGVVEAALERVVKFKGSYAGDRRPARPLGPPYPEHRALARQWSAQTEVLPRADPTSADPTSD